MTITLIVGTILAITGLAFVMLPLFLPLKSDHRPGGAATASPEDVSDPVAALREIEFDRETGKLSDDDYVALKSEFTARALEQMREVEDDTRRAEAPIAHPQVRDAVEAVVRRMKR